MAASFALSQWQELKVAFQSFFGELGEIDATNERLHFRSVPPHVQTQFTIHANGIVTASMPLHGLEALFDGFEFDHIRNAVCCTGNGATYTYTVPQELLQLKGGNE